MLKVAKTVRRSKVLAAGLAVLLIAVMVMSGVTVSDRLSPQSDSLFQLGIGQRVITIGTVAYAAGTADYTCDGVADDVQFQAALDALPAAGGKLSVLAGTYVFTNAVTRAIDNITIEGVGLATYITRDGLNPVFSAGVQSNWVFKDFRVDALAGLNVLTATNYTMENVTLNVAHIAYLTDKANITAEQWAIPSGRGATLVVAASDASAASIAQADYVCDGTADNVQIMAADAALPAGGGTVQLTEGTFTIAATLNLSQYTSLRGTGRSTILTAVNNLNSPIIEQTNNDVEISHLLGDGNGANQSAGYPTCFLVMANNIKLHDFWATDADTDNIAVQGNNVEVYNFESWNAGQYGEAGAGLQVSADEVSIKENINIHDFYIHGTTQAGICFSAHGAVGAAKPDRYITVERGRIDDADPWAIRTDWAAFLPATDWEYLTVKDIVITDSQRAVINSIVSNSLWENITVISATEQSAFSFDDTCSYNTLKHCIAYQPQLYGFNINAPYTTLIDCVSVNAGQAVANTYSQVWLDSSADYSQIINFQAIGDSAVLPRYGLRFSTDCDYISVIGGLFTGSARESIRFERTAGSVITGVKMPNSGSSGIYVGTGSTGVTVSNNISTNHGSVVGGGGIKFAGVTHSIITGNVCQNGQTGVGSYIEDSSYNRIIANDFSDLQGAHTQGRGIEELGSSDYNEYGFNIATGNTVVQFAFVGAHNIYSQNQGYIGGAEIKYAAGVLTAGNANAICFAWHDPELQDILIKKVTVEVTTGGGTVGSHLDVGIADDAAGTARGTEFFNDLLLNDVDINDSWVAGDGGTQTKWVFCQDSASATDGWIVGQILDANAANLVGKYYIEYVGR